MSGPQRSPSQTQLVPKSPSSSSPRVFEFPDQLYPETPNTNFDFEDFVRAAAEGGSSVEDLRTPKSASCYYNLSGQQSSSPGPAKQLNKPKKSFSKTLSCPPKRRNSLAMAKSPLSPSLSWRNSASPDSSFSASSGNLKNFDQDTRMVNKQINKSQSFLNESNSDNSKSAKTSSRRSTSDLTDITDADTVISCPKRRGSMKGGLGKSYFYFPQKLTFFFKF